MSHTQNLPITYVLQLKILIILHKTIFILEVCHGISWLHENVTTAMYVLILYYIIYTKQPWAV